MSYVILILCYSNIRYCGGEDHFLKHMLKPVRLDAWEKTKDSPICNESCDHPMGGRTKGGSQPVTAKGI